MNRAKDLDTIAPDDMPNDNQKKPEPSEPTRPVKKTKKVSSSSQNDSKNQKYRQQVYELLKNKTKSSLDPFLVKPKIFDFQERQSEEEIILVLRRHWVTNITWILTAIIMILAPALLKYVPLLSSFPVNFQLVALIIWYLVTIAFTFEKFLSWYFNLYIITDERIIDIDFNNLIDKKFTDAKISMIQDVTSRITGVPQTMFNFGNILIQTASEIPEIVFEKVPNPDIIIKVLQLMRQEEEQETLEGRIR